MGSRAVITASTSEFVKNSNDIGVYVHWNGSPLYVKGFLEYCKLHRYREPDGDSYGWAMLCNVITNYFGDGLSCGINGCKYLHCDNHNNGVYVIRGWDIVKRLYTDDKYDYTRVDKQDLLSFILKIDAAQPKSMQLGEGLIKSRLEEQDREAMIFPLF